MFLTSPPHSLLARGTKRRVVLLKKNWVVVDDVGVEREMFFEGGRKARWADELRSTSRGRATYELDARGKRRLVARGVWGWLGVLAVVNNNVVGTLVCVAGLALIVFTPSNAVRLSVCVPFAVCLLGTAISSMVYSRLPWIRRRNIATVLTHVFARLKRSRCGACEYDMTGSVAGHDGRTTCAECGAEWNVAGWQASLPKGKSLQTEQSLQAIGMKDEAREFVLLLQGKSKVLANLGKRERRARLQAIEHAHFVREIKRFRLWETIGIVALVVVTGVLGWLENNARGFHEVGVVDVLLPVLLGVVVKIVVSVVRAMLGALAEVRRTLTAKGVCSACETKLEGRACHADGMVVCDGCAARFVKGEWVKAPRYRLARGTSLTGTSVLPWRQSIN